jgi:uncharacterized protein YneF (UPF0154 family)
MIWVYVIIGVVALLIAFFAGMFVHGWIEDNAQQRAPKGTEQD